MHYQTVLFDLDGTLTDPREGITRSIQFALSKLGIDEPDLTRLEHFIGPPLLQAFMQFYDFDEPKAWEAVNFYRERFKVTGLYENRVFDGVTPLLETLVDKDDSCISPPPSRGCSPVRSPGISTSPNTSK
jgi:phosphoglycolate phosphatase